MIKRITPRSCLIVCTILLLVLTVVLWYRTYIISIQTKKIISKCLLTSIQSVQRVGPWLDKNDNPVSIKVADMNNASTIRTAKSAFFLDLLLRQSSLPLYKVTGLSWLNTFPPGGKAAIIAHADVKIPVILGWTATVSVTEEETINSAM